MGTQVEGEKQLIDVPDMVEFDSGEHPIRGELEIRNLSRHPVIFKVKTTQPDNYRIYPYISTLGKRESIPVNIIVNRDVYNWSIPKARFQVEAMILPKNPLNSGGDDGELDIGMLMNIWKDLEESANGEIESHRINASLAFHSDEESDHDVPARQQNPDDERYERKRMGSSEPEAVVDRADLQQMVDETIRRSIDKIEGNLLPDRNEMREPKKLEMTINEKQFEELFQRVSGNVSKSMDEKYDYIQNLLYYCCGFLVLFVVFIISFY